MTAEGAFDFEALEALAASLLDLFSEAGYIRVAPSFIQPASLFLDRIGEALRVRTYVFTDPNGEELCLRPEMTIPVCRVFLERSRQSQKAKFSYNGPAFRIQEGKAGPMQPREFRQAGVERFGSADLDADLEVIGLTVKAMHKGGLKDFTLKTGHIGLFTALLNTLDMPQRWRDRLAHAFRRPGAFGRELALLSGASSRPPVAPGADMMTEKSFLEALDARGIGFIGLRRPDEIVKRLQDRAADARERPLAQEVKTVLESFLRTSGPMSSALDALERLFEKSEISLDAEVAEARALHDGLRTVVAPANIIFEAGFGRHFEYYTGMVFQIEIEGKGVAGQIAGGGRYDGLVRALAGGSVDVPAVGAAIHTERLLAASRQ